MNNCSTPGPPKRSGGRLMAAEHPYYAQIHTLRVSAHYFIRRTGETLCFVPPELRAWHAGVSSWRGRERCNDFSIGIELEGCDTLPFEPVQYEALAGLLADLCTRFPIAGITGHSDIAPGRKTDPGPWFSWGRLSTLLVAAGHAEVARLVTPEGAAAPGDDGLLRWPFPVTARPGEGRRRCFGKPLRAWVCTGRSVEDNILRGFQGMPLESN